MSDLTPTTNTPDFAEITQLIESARQRAYQAVNTALIELYWQVGAYISAKIKATEWGEGVIEQLARHLASTQPGLRGGRTALFERARALRKIREAEVMQHRRDVEHFGVPLQSVSGAEQRTEQVAAMAVGDQYRRSGAADQRGGGERDGGIGDDHVAEWYRLREAAAQPASDAPQCLVELGAAQPADQRDLLRHAQPTAEHRPGSARPGGRTSWGRTISECR